MSCMYKHEELYTNQIHDIPSQIIYMTNKALCWSAFSEVNTVQLQKAIDSVPHCRPLYKLEGYGTSGNLMVDRFP